MVGFEYLWPGRFHERLHISTRHSGHSPRPLPRGGAQLTDREQSWHLHARVHVGSLKCDRNRPRATPCLTMVHRLDVVSVGVEHESSIVAWVICALAGCTVVASTMIHSCTIKRIHCRTVLCLEGKVVTSGQNTESRWAFSRGYDEFVSPEIVLVRAHDGDVQHRQNGRVEVKACLQVAYNKLEVVDKPTTMQFIGFQGLSPYATNFETLSLTVGCGDDSRRSSRARNASAGP